MAYVLGFFAADGNVIKNKRGGEFFSIQIKDKDILIKIRETLNSDHKIGIKKPKKGNILYRLQVGSKEMCEDLRRLGLKEDKTHHLESPEIPKEYFGDFLRGYFDGDGNVWTGEYHKDRKTKHEKILSGFTSSSKKFLVRIKEQLFDFGFKGGSLSCKENYYRLYYSILDSSKLYKLMYSSSSFLYLERKKIVFDRFFERHLEYMRP